MCEPRPAAAPSAHDGGVQPPLPLRSARRRLSAAPVLAAALLAVLALAGCSGGEAAQEPPAPLSTAATSATAAVGASDAASADPSASLDPSAPPTNQDVTSMTTFSAPSGRISCSLTPVKGEGPFARCDISEKTWKADPPADGCAGRWGGDPDQRGSVGVGDGDSAVLCATDDLGASPGPKVAYGSTITMGQTTCTVDRNGVTCKNAATGKGFAVKRDAYDLTP